MEKLKTFEEFVNEALFPSQFRHYVQLFNRNRYKKVFKQYKEKYDGDRNAYRIYLPLLTQERNNPTEKEIKNFLTDNGYEIIDYLKGTCKFKTAKNPSKIGQILTKLKEDRLMKKFVEDPERKKGDNSELMVCISRHPYDVVGSDTDRDWTNCMSLPLSTKHPRIKKMKKQNKDVTDYLRSGENIQYLEYEVKEGTLAAYLIKKDDKNINNPLAVLNIKPYVKGKEIYLNACSFSYGVQNLDFKYTVIKWLEEVNEGKSGVFKIKNNLYRDRDTSVIYTKGRTLKDWLDENYGDSDLSRIDSIGCAGYALTSLEGIEKLPNLRTFHCYANRLTSLKGIENCPKLSDLRCYENLLTSLEGIENLTNLDVLHCQDNQITSLLPLKNLKKLKILHVYYNSLSSIEGIEELTNLMRLYIHYNYIYSLESLEKLVNLNQLLCPGNQIASLKGIENLKNLRTLQCGENNLKSLEGVENLIRLRELYCNHNQITSLEELRGLNSLELLECQNNKIESLSPLEELHNLGHLKYNNNNLENIPKYFIKRFGGQ